MDSSEHGTGDNEVTQSTWTTLSWFQIQYLQRPEDNTIAKVFRNGRQQVPITVLVQARNSDNEVVPLPNVDLQNIQLVNYNTGTPWSQGVTVTNARNAKYDYFPEGSVLPEPYQVVSKDVANTKDAPSNLPAALKTRHISCKPRKMVSRDGTIMQVQEFELWLSVTTDETLRIAASLTTNGQTFHTHSPEVPAGGEPHDGGLFNSSIRVGPQEPRSFTSQYFTMTSEEGPSTEHISVLMYDLWFSDTQYKIREAFIYHRTWETGWYFAGRGVGRGVYAAYHYAAASDWAYFYHYGSNFDAWVHVAMNERLKTEGKANLARVLELNNLFYHSEPQVGKMGYVDNYGNESIIYLREDAQGSRIRLADS
jgi:hypothetical protein